MKPLTIEQLKSLEVGDWVWIVDELSNIKGYAQVEASKAIGDKGFIIPTKRSYGFGYYDTYGTKWLAYKNKEQAEISHERHETGKMAKIVGLCDYNDMTCEQCRLKNNMHVCMHRLAMQKLLDAGYVNIEDRKQKGEIVELPYKTEKLQLGDTVYYLQNYFNDATLQHERKVKR
ncbi:MAG: hypothetical protein K2L51_07410, partial [Clostridiales bacterium]|nr:hypothetical protein [Clostridiales bacterium]